MEEGCFATFTCLIKKYLRCFSIYTALNRTLRVRLSERDTIEKTPPRADVSILYGKVASQLSLA